jgi:hypothetical protein
MISVSVIFFSIIASGTFLNIHFHNEWIFNHPIRKYKKTQVNLYVLSGSIFPIMLIVFGITLHRNF